MAKYIMGQPYIHDPWWELRRRRTSRNPGTCSLKPFENFPRKNGREPLSGRSLAATIYSRLGMRGSRLHALLRSARQQFQAQAAAAAKRHKETRRQEEELTRKPARQSTPGSR